MGLIVPFRLRLTRPRRPRPEQPCVVTLFTGVRYDRSAREGLAPDRRPLDRTAGEARRPDDRG
jgi:hypothetical protein